MKTAPASIRPRQRGPKAPLSREAVVGAALQCLQAGGPEVLTMRKVAALLETGPGSLYVYVRDQDELHVLVLDAIAAEVTRPRAGAGGLPRLVKLLLDYSRQMFRYPGAARLALGTPPTGPAYLDLFESALSLLVTEGLDVRRAVWAVDALFLLVTAAVAEQDARRRDDASRSIPDLYGAAIDGGEPGSRPLLRAARAELATEDGEQRLSWSIRAFLAGAIRAAEPAEPGAAAPPGARKNKAPA
jgi:AcrR family transcriptional regulator